MSEREPVDGVLPSLLRMIAHDLKGLLGTPGLLLHLAESAEDEAELESRLAALRESFKALDRAVTDVGEIGHVVGSGASPSFHPTDVRGLVETTLALAASAARQRRIELVAALAPGPWPPVRGDADLLTRTFQRLVFWGVTHTASGARLQVDAGIEDGAFVLRVPAGPAALAPVPTVRERLAELGAGERELGVALPLAREALERHGGTLTAREDGVLEARIPLEGS